MKAEMIEGTEKEFRPIKIELILESEADVQSLWHRLNVSTETVEKGSDAGAIITVDVDQPLWNVLKEIVRDNKIPLFGGRYK